MELRPLGNTGLEVSPIGFGAFKIGRNQKTKYEHHYELPDQAQVDALLKQHDHEVPFSRGHHHAEMVVAVSRRQLVRPLGLEVGIGRSADHLDDMPVVEVQALM